MSGSGRPCAADELTPGFRELVTAVDRTLAAYGDGAAAISLTCYGRPGDLLDIAVAPVNPDACPIRVQATSDGCYLQLRLAGCVFSHLSLEQACALVGAVCAGRIRLRRWSRTDGEPYRWEVRVQLHRGGTVRETASTGWALRRTSATTRHYAAYQTPGVAHRTRGYA
ncbi:MAG: hypothetical protein ACRDT6_11195 [Micromonosporaceae bacterium]